MIQKAAAERLAAFFVLVCNGWVTDNPLSEYAKTNQIPFLQSLGVTVNYTT